MNPQRLIVIILCIILCRHSLAQTQNMDTGLSVMTESLAAKIKDHGSKKVTVLDFTDLQGASSELGKYIAEQLTVDLVLTNRVFSVLDRANLKSILAEHKLTAQGLVDPENAKKLGMFAGVDALILGTIIPKGNSITLTAKIITTDTAEIVGAARVEFNADATVQEFLSKPATEVAANYTDGSTQDAPRVVKTFGDLRVEMQSLRIVNGKQFLMTMVLTNQNPKKSIWIALNADLGRLGNPLTAVLTDSAGVEYHSDGGSVSGLPVASFQRYFGFSGQGAEIKPSDSISATIRFYSLNRTTDAASGTCQLQLEFLLLHPDSYGRFDGAAVQNLVCGIKSN